eukprot:1041382-Rhodomonas_salina.1
MERAMRSFGLDPTQRSAHAPLNPPREPRTQSDKLRNKMATSDSMIAPGGYWETVRAARYLVMPAPLLFLMGGSVLFICRCLDSLCFCRWQDSRGRLASVDAMGLTSCMRARRCRIRRFRGSCTAKTRMSARLLANSECDKCEECEKCQECEKC